MRFTHEVPQTLIGVPCPDLTGENADNYEVIGTKEMHNLAQQVGSYYSYGQEDDAYFMWSNNLGAAHAFEQLHGFNGILVTDGHAAYSKTVSQLTTLSQQITHASCCEHGRRMFEKAHDSAPKESACALQLIRQLYQVEKRMRGSAATPQKITECRLKYSKLIVDPLFKWCYE